MTREQLQQAGKVFFEILNAFKDGKTIQIKYPEKWIDIEKIALEGLLQDSKIYRIKPEPRHFWIATEKNEGLFVSDIKWDAKNSTSRDTNIPLIHVQEVIE